MTKTKIQSGSKKKSKPKKTFDLKPRLKKAFDLSRDSIYVADPTTQLRICGARGTVPAEEAGELDTPPGPGIPVKDMRRLRLPLRPEFVSNIDRRTVRVPVIIGKIDDVATVLVGKRRVRAARRVNRQRAEEGRPLIKIRCVIQRDVDEQAILETIILENNAREDDTLADKIEKLKAYLRLGPSEADAAVEFCVTPARIREWLEYDDCATDAVKRAVASGEIPASTGMELARIGDVDRQRAALAKIEGGTGAQDRSARAARALARGENHLPTATDKKSQRLLLAYLQAPVGQSVRHRSERTEFWRGVQEALKIVTGQETEDAELRRALTVARSQGATAPNSTPTAVKEEDSEEASP